MRQIAYFHLQVSIDTIQWHLSALSPIVSSKNAALIFDHTQIYQNSPQIRIIKRLRWL